VGASYRAAVEASQLADAQAAATADKKQAAAAQASSCLAGFAAAARADARNPSSSSGTGPGSLEGAEAAVADFASFFRDRLGSLSLDGSGQQSGAMAAFGLPGARRSPTPVLGPAGGQRSAAAAAAGGPLGLFGLSGAWGDAAVAAASGEATARADDEAAENLDAQLLPRPVQLAAWLPGLPEPSAYGPGDDGAVEGADYSGAAFM
jgi:hypothetical protein